MSSDLTVNEAGPADLIAAVWYTLGFRPLNSLVLVSLHGSRGRVGSMLRVDLTPAWLGPAGVVQVLDSAIDALKGPAAAMFGVPPEPEGEPPPPGHFGRPVHDNWVSGDLPPDPDEDLPPRVVALVATHDALSVPPPAVIRALPHRMLKAGLWLYDVIGITPTGFRSLRCPDESCCPSSGRPLSQVETSRVAVAHVLRGDQLAASEEDMIADIGRATDDPGASPTRAGGSREHDLGVEGESGGAQAGPADIGERARRLWWRTWSALLGHAEGWSSDELQVRSLNDPFLRDAIFVRLAAAPGELRQRLLGQLLAGRAAPNLSDHWEELFSEKPDRVLLNRGEEVLAALARRSTAAERGPVLTVLALLAWYRGNGVRTRLLMERVREESPDLPGALPRLAELVEMLCITGTAPPWVELPGDRQGG
ncbi:DUF4192 domain-containing protein [Kineosporia succinea]|uniref:DUF4192 family protein n=1 Tax=Kineosporia succinea TaxID=84632 RepID=A0ABT9NVV8_9ACTN|nr:DUF4192 domain-containing protein [Kineosporia succinea]MDP9824559.1 hypothetical protein [Kineosporia succinea]